MKAHKRLMMALDDLANPGREAENRLFNLRVGRGHNRRGCYEVRRTPSGSFLARHISGEFLGPTHTRDMIDFMMQRADDERIWAFKSSKLCSLKHCREAARNSLREELDSARLALQKTLWGQSTEVGDE